MDLDIVLFNPAPEKFYFIFSFPYYTTFVFYGTETEAVELFLKKCEMEGTGTLRRADPHNPQDAELVREEIINVELDIASGIKGLPQLPRKGWI